MREGRGKYYTLLVFVICAFNVYAQEISVKGGFVEDSISIGQDVHFWISASYPPDLEVIFPDSLYDFAPFELSYKTFFPSEIKEGMAYDSTVYSLQSFEIDKIQYLKLRATLLKEYDSTFISTGMDSVFLKELLSVVSDSTQLKTNLAYQLVDTEFNYPLMYYILGGLIILIILLLLIFGKRIAIWIKTRRLKKQYEQFSEKLGSYITTLKVNPEPALAEETLTFWKNYQQKLDKIPFSVYTTKEILSQSFTSELANPLKSIDRVVYGNRMQENIYQDFQQLEDFSQDRYVKKIAEIKYGK